MIRHYGLKHGMRGTHFITGDAILEVVHTEFWDNNRAQFRFVGGDHDGEEFNSTAEHFKELPKSSEK